MNRDCRSPGGMPQDRARGKKWHAGRSPHGQDPESVCEKCPDCLGRRRDDHYARAGRGMFTCSPLLAHARRTPVSFEPLPDKPDTHQMVRSSYGRQRDVVSSDAGSSAGSTAYWRANFRVESRPIPRNGPRSARSPTGIPNPVFGRSTNSRGTYLYNTWRSSHFPVFPRIFWPNRQRPCKLDNLVVQIGARPQD